MKSNVLLCMILLLSLAWSGVAGGVPGIPPRRAAARILETADLSGGLIVHLGCGDGRLTAALRAGERYVVHGLERDEAQVERARAYVRSAGLNGTVSVQHWSGYPELPYADNLVNLIVAEDADVCSDEEMMRVLAPGGVLCVRQGDEWTARVKPRAEGTDEWTHFEHDAGRSCISADALAGPPARLRWLAGSRWPLYRTFRDPPVGFVSARGRNFYWVTSPKDRPGDPDHSRLLCRDAYNGLLLWERAVAGPSRPTGMVAQGERLYVHFSGRDGLVALDAPTGKTVQQFKDEPADYWGVLAYRSGVLVDSGGGRIQAFKADGALLWEKASRRGPDSFVVGEKAVFFLQPTDDDVLELLSCGLRTGHENWRTMVAGPEQAEGHVTQRTAIISVVGDRLILGSASRYAKPQNAANLVFSTETGERLFRYEYTPAGHGGRTASVFPLDGRLWVKTRDAWHALNPATGAEQASVPEVSHRCYPDHATRRHIFTGKMDFLDLKEGAAFRFMAARSGCGSGFVPANGLVYSYPSRCLCYPMLRGYMAFSSDDTELAFQDSPAVLPGEMTAAPMPQHPQTEGHEWPTLRHDGLRSGSSPVELPADLEVSWSVEAGRGALSSPVVAGGTVFVSCPAEQTLHAVNADSGRTMWTASVGAPVDSPPTVWRGRVIFGAADGRVYCLDATDGRRLWQFSAAPARRLIVVRGKVESAWPVHGSVLVRDGIVYFGAGRHTYVDGGIVFCAMEARSGRLLWRRLLSRKDGSDLCDVLLTDGSSVYIGARFQFAPTDGDMLSRGTGRALWAPGGLLGDNAAISGMRGTDNWRKQWFYGSKREKDHFWRDEREGWRGNLLAFDEEMVFGVRQDLGMSSDDPGEDVAPQAERASLPSEVFGMSVDADKGWLTAMPPPEEVRLNSLAVARDSVLVAGSGADGGFLWRLSAADGALRSRIKLPAAPRFDGLAIADGRLFVSGADGRLSCLAGTSDGASGEGTD